MMLVKQDYWRLRPAYRETRLEGLKIRAIGVKLLFHENIRFANFEDLVSRFAQAGSCMSTV